MKKPTDKQSSNNGRDDKGRFQKGHNNGFTPGQSGNPAGRPKSVTLSEALRIELAKDNPENTEQSYAEKIAAVLVQSAAGGNLLAAKEIADRTEGKPKQSVDVDMSMYDWRELARVHGLNERDVITEAQRIIAEQSAAHSGH